MLHRIFIWFLFTLCLIFTVQARTIFKDVTCKNVKCLKDQTCVLLLKNNLCTPDKCELYPTCQNKIQDDSPYRSKRSNGNYQPSAPVDQSYGNVYPNLPSTANNYYQQPPQNGGYHPGNNYPSASQGYYTSPSPNYYPNNNYYYPNRPSNSYNPSYNYPNKPANTYYPPANGNYYPNRPNSGYYPSQGGNYYTTPPPNYYPSNYYSTQAPYQPYPTQNYPGNYPNYYNTNPAGYYQNSGQNSVWGKINDFFRDVFKG